MRHAGFFENPLPATSARASDSTLCRSTPSDQPDLRSLTLSRTATRNAGPLQQTTAIASRATPTINCSEGDGDRDVRVPLETGLEESSPRLSMLDECSADPNVSLCGQQDHSRVYRVLDSVLGEPCTHAQSRRDRQYVHGLYARFECIWQPCSLARMRHRRVSYR